MFDRRVILVGAACGLASACTVIKSSGSMNSPSRLAGLESQIGGRLGVAALDMRSGATLTHRGDERFAMCSTFKWLLAAIVLGVMDHGGIPPDLKIPYSLKDLLDFSPVTTAHAAQGFLTVDALCEAAVEMSDNTAANLLLSLIGGPARFTRLLRKLNDPVTRLDRNEPDLNANTPGDERDTTTPNAMVRTMEKILAGDSLFLESQERLWGWMKNSTTGLSRLRAGLPKAWMVGDKTGTGQNGAANDVAIAWPPGRPPILIAAYLSDSSAKAEDLDAAHAEIGRIVATSFA